MTENAKINGTRVILGGIAAGIVHFAVTGIVNGLILQGDLHQWMNGVGALLNPPAPAVSMGLWAVMSLSYGILGLWFYAGLRRLYGAGPATALRVAAALWIVSKFTVALDLTALGLIPAHIIVGQTIGGLAAILLALLAGAWLYRE